MVNETLERGRGLNLKELYNEPEWSMFLQYISHMFKQSRDLSEFIARTEITLRRTYGYDQLSDENKKLLLNSVREYAAELNKGIATLADSTGLSPETIKSISREVRGSKLTKSDWKADSMFSSSPDSLRKLVGIMLRTPEIKKQLRDIKIRGQEIRHYTLSKLISAWVRGNDIPTISKTYFGSDHHENISDCVSAIYGKLVLSAAWGLSAFQKLSQRELDFENLSEKEKKQLSNLPAMIYYGVNTDEAILMRKANVPRSISRNLGTELKSQFGDEVYTKTVDEASKWLVELPETRWQNAVPPKSDITGKDYKRIWQLLSGESYSS